MSIDSCRICAELTDTDYDCEAYTLYYEDGELDVLACHCEDHRYFKTKQEIIDYCNKNNIHIM